MYLVKDCKSFAILVDANMYLNSKSDPQHFLKSKYSLDLGNITLQTDILKLRIVSCHFSTKIVQRNNLID